MPGHFEKKSRVDSEIPTASLADMVFVLLLFFMVTTTVRSVQVKVNINYPHAKNIEKITQKQRLAFIYVGPRKGIAQNNQAQGSKNNVAIQINNSFVTMNEIAPIMRQKYTEKPGLIVSIKMDRNTKTGILIDIQQQLQQAGALRINYAAKPPNNTSGQ